MEKKRCEKRRGRKDWCMLCNVWHTAEACSPSLRGNSRWQKWAKTGITQNMNKSLESAISNMYLVYARQCQSKVCQVNEQVDSSRWRVGVKCWETPGSWLQWTLASSNAAGKHLLWSHIQTLQEQKTQLPDITMLNNLRSEKAARHKKWWQSPKWHFVNILLATERSPQHTRNLAICVNRCEYIDYTYPLEVIQEANLIKVRLDIISNLLESTLILWLGHQTLPR